MDVKTMISELREELEQIDQIIIGLERLGMARSPRRGRPPNWIKDLPGAKRRRGRPLGSKNVPKTSGDDNPSS